MAGFLYFLPGETTKPTDDRLEELGLGHLTSKADGPRLIPHDAHGLGAPTGVAIAVAESDGPEEAPHGLLLALRHTMDDRPLVIDSESQEWTQAPAGFWIGYHRDARPTPSELARESLLSGYEVTLDDGDCWVLPIIREVAKDGEPMSALPAILVRDKVTRDLVPGPTVPRFAYLWKATDWAWEAMVSETDVDDIEAERTVALLFGANYRVGPEELLACGVYSTNVRPEGLLALAIGYNQWADWRANQVEAGAAE